MKERTCWADAWFKSERNLSEKLHANKIFWCIEIMTEKEAENDPEMNDLLHCAGGRGMFIRAVNAGCRPFCG